LNNGVKLKIIANLYLKKINTTTLFNKVKLMIYKELFKTVY